MQETLLSVQNYLMEILGEKVKIGDWKRQKELPFFLTDSYFFYEMVLLKKNCLLMVKRENGEIAPGVIRKHLEQVIRKWDGPCILVQNAISSYNRKRLIEHRVPFIDPGNQLYLPDLGINLKEHLNRLRTPKKILSPATQVVLIMYFLNKTKEPFSPSDLVKQIGYSNMTMTRVFDELEDANIGTVYRKGKERFWNYQGDRQELWEKAKPMLRSPVKLRTWVKSKKPYILAGVSALGHLTLLNPPLIPVYAISWEKWKLWKASGVKELRHAEEGSYELEIWHYDPELLAEKNIVDPFSLYLSLESNQDERIEKALEELWGTIRW